MKPVKKKYKKTKPTNKDVKFPDLIIVKTEKQIHKERLKDISK